MSRCSKGLAVGKMLLFAGIGLAGFARAEDAPRPATPAAPKVGEARDGGTIVPTQQLVRPAGQAVEFSGRPVDEVVAPGGKSVYVKDNRGLVVLDTENWTVRQELKFPRDGGSMYGIAVTPDGRRVYATGSRSTLWEGLIGEDATVKWGRAIVLPGVEENAANRQPAAKKRGSYPCGVALAADGKTAYVCLSVNNTLAVVDLEAGQLLAEIPVGVAPFAVAVAPDGSRAYVSNWGGRRPKAGDRTASSAGTPTVIDARGIASGGTIGVVDLRGRKMVAEVGVGLHPAGLVMRKDGHTLYVANANSDTVSAVDTTRLLVSETIPVRPDPLLPFGSASNALALSDDQQTLFVANGGNNAVAVVELAEHPDATKGSRLAGFIPAGWYPGAVACAGNNLVIANVKGIGSRDAGKLQKGWSTYFYRGTVTRVARPDAATLARYTEQVRADARVPESLAAAEKAAAGAVAVPVPQHVGEPSVFKHVVYVIKENRTYDQVFGDVKAGNGDASLCIFGRKVTPNHHALADQFVLLDNFYCNGVLSADGHQWATEGDVVDGVEKSFGGWTRSYPYPGDDPLAFVSSGFIWDNALLCGLSFRNYGEMGLGQSVPVGASFTKIYQDLVQKTGKLTFKQATANENLARYTCPDYPGWNLTIPDVVRADIFLKEFKQFEQTGQMPNLVIVYLPSDHTRGTAPDAPTPAAMVADNDLALGRVVEAISKSQFWKDTCVFAIEDDPQNGFDHVDGHRSVCIVASPYTKRHAVVSAFYNQTSVLHTMELMLGLPAMNQMDAMAPVMRECFSERPDLAPYAAVPNEIPLDQMNLPLKALRGEALRRAEQSLAQRTEQPDQVDDNTFNRILWYSMKGDGAPYPAAFAGAHGKGLAKFGLKVEPKKRGRDDDDDD